MKYLFLFFIVISSSTLFAQELRFAKIFSDNMVLQKGKELPIWGFAIAGKDLQWHWAEAKIQGDQITLRSTQTKDPLFVRYGFANNPIISLYNKYGLPAPPFRTDK